jgi:battenin
VGHEGGDDDDELTGEDEVKRKMEREFRIGATGAADSCGESKSMWLVTGS